MRKFIWILILGGTVLCSFVAGFYYGNSRVDQIPPQAKGQYATLRLFEEYRQTGDPRKREAVERASGESEILAGRIFRAFRIFSSRHQSPEDKAFADNTLGANKKLSLSVLRLLFSERPDENDGDRMLERDMMRTTYLGWCAGIAVVEKDGVASDILRDLSQHENQDVAKEALSLLEYIAQNNYLVKSKAYRQSKSWHDLQWIELQCFRMGKDKAEIIHLLGKPDFDDGGALIAYRGKRDHPDGNYMWLGFLDTQLVSWEWGESPSQEANRRKQELQKWMDSR